LEIEMHQARTVSVSIARPWEEVYEAIWRPEDFPKWASGLSASPLVRDGDWWSATGPEGPVRIRFTGRNAFGVMDHRVDPGTGPEVHVPMRVVPNGGGAEVLVTLFRRPGMSDEAFAADAEWVLRDLLALKALLTPR
jgi:hypothetical protein